MTDRDTTLVIPAYNESKRLPTALATLSHFSFQEIIVVDDGSTDDTAAVVKTFIPKLPNLKLISYKENKGKGYAVRKGVEIAAAKVVVMYDADGATPPADILRLLKRVDDKTIVIGSRLISGDTRVSFVPSRRLIGLVFHWICYPLIPGVRDASCGAKAFPLGAARVIFEAQRLNRFAFDIEIVWLARCFGYNLEEVAVNWRSVPGSKVKVWRDAPEMFFAVMGLYLRKILS